MSKGFQIAVVSLLGLMVVLQLVSLALTTSARSVALYPVRASANMASDNAYYDTCVFNPNCRANSFSNGSVSGRYGSKGTPSSAWGSNDPVITDEQGNVMPGK